MSNCNVGGRWDAVWLVFERLACWWISRSSSTTPMTSQSSGSVWKPTLLVIVTGKGKVCTLRVAMVANSQKSLQTMNMMSNKFSGYRGCLELHVCVSLNISLAITGHPHMPFLTKRRNGRARLSLLPPPDFHLSRLSNFQHRAQSQ